MGMVELMENAIQLAPGGQMCPFCSMWWDNDELQRIILERGGEGWMEWYEETLALPVNQQGEDLGHRPAGE